MDSIQERVMMARVQYLTRKYYYILKERGKEGLPFMKTQYCVQKLYNWINFMLSNAESSKQKQSFV